jgi:predicted aspartyl protease
MGTFHVACRIENHLDRRRSFDAQMMVDSGSECTWVPRQALEEIGVRREKKTTFIMANGTRLTRSIGFAVIHVGEYLTIDEVVFAEPGDLLLLGARTLEGLNLAVDPVKKRLVRAGPVPVASPIRARR